LKIENQLSEKQSWHFPPLRSTFHHYKLNITVSQAENQAEKPEKSSLSEGWGMVEDIS
jgi:hypothetical protein